MFKQISTLPLPVGISLALIIISVSGCSFSGGSEAPSKIPDELVSGDPATERKSELYYRFLKGMTYLNEEDSGRAAEQFELAAQLSDGQDELLRSQLVAIKIEQGDLDGALRHSKRIIEGDPELFDYLLHACLLDSVDDYVGAQQYYQIVLKKRPNDVTAGLFLANAFYQSQRIADAQRQLQKIAKLHPKLAIIQYYLGNLAWEQGDKRLAASYFEKAIKLEPDNKKIQLANLAIVIDNGELKRAERLIQVIIGLWEEESLLLVLKATSALIGKGQGPGAVLFLKSFLGEQALEIQELRRHIGILQVQNRDFDGAVFSLGLVLAKDSTDAKARYFLGTAYASLGSRKRAIAELQRIPNTEPMYVEAQTFAAFLLRQIGDSSGAEQAVRLALAGLDTPDQSLQIFLIDLLRSSGKYVEAKDIVKEMLKAEPEDVKLLFLYGSILEELGRHDQAVQTMEDLIKKDPSHSKALNFIAYNLAERRLDLDRALMLSERSLADYPEDGYFLDTKGWILYRQGRLPEAQSILSRAVNLTGDDPVIMEHYAEVLIAGGEIERGLSVYISIAQKNLDLADPEIKSLLARARQRIKNLVKTKPELKKLVEVSGYEW